ncbi:MAG: HNH/ENDO VII family nuclease [Clostridia bacterium]|nr:HNH/ENDO VII family nuclease [Clostridia bacterium]
MKKLISIILGISLIFGLWSNCFSESSRSNYSGLNDPSSLPYVEDTLYAELINTLHSDEYFVENVNAIYISQEYLDEVAFNSQTNLFFGFNLLELNQQYTSEKYIFTLGENGTTTVEPFETYYDDTYDRIIRNVAIGTGIILICVTVSTVTTSIPAISLIFSVAADTGVTAALTGAMLGGVSAGIIEAIQTGNIKEALKTTAIAGSEGFKWGAITGIIAGGASEAIALKGATLNGLTMNEAAFIQKQSGYPIDVIKGFKSLEQYEICQDAGLMPQMINGKIALIRDIDLNYIDDFGRTNLQRMQQGLSALDSSTGQAYQLHHIGQEMNSTLAILTESEHMQGGNNLIWHELGEASQINRSVFAKQRSDFWKAIAKLASGGN